MPGLAGNIKATTPIAFTTTLLVWGLMSFGRGFEGAGQATAALDSIRWGSDYLLKVHQALPNSNQSMLVTRVSSLLHWRHAGSGCSRHTMRISSNRPVRPSLSGTDHHATVLQ